ncbi:predicted protein [Aspergillus terreus NIH2624]|uniref:phosphoethanolamine N-methyltransferase n=1 Tax=Aspergillus terreus (strain NIH 2624 / FGSC A1156) TaxID=341663 RepID=Q0C8F3_ASPTN|nr:uncharacterized protein ATEG_10031 [Aspergillus terreus NIH2624]EAU29480.1 predicted protein [Aspergillus terreus NIH2624]
MTAGVDALFSSLGARYEAAFGKDKDLQDFIEFVARVLPAESRTLDVGCGTGKPVSFLLASAGHKVHGIDISEEMVTIAASQVPGVFHVADMKTYQPPDLFDAVFAIRSLFQLPPCEVCSMITRFSQWIKIGGYVILGVTPSTSLSPQKATYDPTWDCVWMFDKPWMGSYVNDLFLSEQRWCQLLQESGFVLETEPVSYLFSPSGQEHAPEAHYLILARKVELEPLLGPYPLPRRLRPLQYEQPKDLFSHRLVSNDLDELFGRLNSADVLCIGSPQNYGRFASPQYQFLDARIERSSFTPRTFRTVLAMWQMDYVLNMDKTIQKMVHAADRMDSRIVIIQGGPYNEVLQLLGSVTRSCPVGHQGYLLQSAIRCLTNYGYGNIKLHRIEARYDFQEEDLLDRCSAAAELLAGIWHQQHPQCERIKEALRERLQLHFRVNAHSIAHGMVAIVAGLSL